MGYALSDRGMSDPQNQEAKLCRQTKRPWTNLTLADGVLIIVTPRG
jgi:hypothetical protein